MNTVIKEFNANNLKIVYLKNEENNVGMCILPKNSKVQADFENIYLEPLTHVFLKGDNAHTGFANGATMKNGETVSSIKFVKQETQICGEDTLIKTHLLAENKFELTHYTLLNEKYNVVKCYSEIKNTSEKDLHIDMITSFSQNVNPYLNENDDSIELVRLQSFWASEGKKQRQTLEELHFEKSWSGHGIRFLKYGAIGSLPVKEYFPFGAIKDNKNKICFSAMLETPFSWQMELTRYEKELSFSGGIADMEFGHFSKTLKQHQRFETPKALFCAVVGDEEDALREFNIALNANIKYIPKSEEDIPVVFNEFCTTWGTPSLETIKVIAERIKNLGFGYFVIDAGWYQELDESFKGGFGGWTGNCENLVGDWDTCYELFPNGMLEAADYLRSLNMIPGLWFEPENVGMNSRTAKEKESFLLKREGYTIKAGKRRFLNMVHPEIKKHLYEKVIKLLKDNNFGYVKIDYNESIGVGCDGYESLGEGLRQNVLATLEFFELMHKEIPELVFENCASGGHRVEPSMLAVSSMNSFSDAHECLSIPIIASNIGKIVPARQNQVWCVLRKEDDEKRMNYSLSATFMGRMCISGDAHLIDDNQLNILGEAIKFYKHLKPLILNGQQFVVRTNDKKYNHPYGSQLVIRKNENYVLAIGHSFENAENVEFAMNSYLEVAATFGKNNISLQKNKIVFKPNEDFVGCGVLFRIK